MFVGIPVREIMDHGFCLDSRTKARIGKWLCIHTCPCSCYVF